MIESAYINHNEVKNAKLYPLIQQLVISFVKDDNQDVRFYSYKAIIAMINMESAEVILNIWSRKFDEESSYSEFHIL